ncbi:MAG TPA: copper-binding protein [Candidatus Binatia bacterium]|nr:copper-binding protein [Candidatus Binatia bacterium]
MSFQGLLRVSCLLISSALLALPFQSFASKHTKKTTPNAEKRQGQTHHPIGWRFTFPKGDAAKGKAVFEKFECHYCHEVRGENFPFPTENAPELSQMGALHPVEFFAESIMNPNSVVPKNYRDAEGRSPMSDFTEKMTVRELIDVSAYIASLRPKGSPKTVAGVGKVIAVVPDKGEVVIEHSEIKGFMDAMTMGYKVNPPSLVKTVSQGDQIQFTIDTERNVITRIEKKSSPAARK